jgi:hypothetical protein
VNGIIEILDFSLKLGNSYNSKFGEIVENEVTCNCAKNDNPRGNQTFKGKEENGKRPEQRVDFTL